jgi:hypothetical protein
VKNGNGEYEPTKYQILLEFNIEKRVGTQARAKAEQITKRYYPCRFDEGKIAVVPFELRNVALSTFEAMITVLYDHLTKKGYESRLSLGIPLRALRQRITR